MNRYDPRELVIINDNRQLFASASHAFKRVKTVVCRGEDERRSSKTAYRG